jgi:hypothetical protein
MLRGLNCAVSMATIGKLCADPGGLIPRICIADDYAKSDFVGHCAGLQSRLQLSAACCLSSLPGHLPCLHDVKISKIAKVVKSAKLNICGNLTLHQCLQVVEARYLLVGWVQERKAA